MIKIMKYDNLLKFIKINYLQKRLKSLNKFQKIAKSVNFYKKHIYLALLEKLILIY